MIGVAAALATALLWALTSMLVKVEARRMGVLSINAYRATVGAVAMLLVFLIFRDPAMLLTVPADRYLAMKATGFLAAGTHSTQITANQVPRSRSSSKSGPIGNRQSTR